MPKISLIICLLALTLGACASAERGDSAGVVSGSSQSYQFGTLTGCRGAGKVGVARIGWIEVVSRAEMSMCPSYGFDYSVPTSDAQSWPGQVRRYPFQPDHYEVKNRDGTFTRIN